MICSTGFKRGVSKQSSPSCSLRGYARCLRRSHASRGHIPLSVCVIGVGDVLCRVGSFALISGCDGLVDWTVGCSNFTFLVCLECLLNFLSLVVNGGTILIFCWSFYTVETSYFSQVGLKNIEIRVAELLRSFDVRI
jgi:hypothetical protein